MICTFQRNMISSCDRALAFGARSPVFNPQLGKWTSFKKYQTSPFNPIPDGEGPYGPTDLKFFCHSNSDRARLTKTYDFVP